jgi:hypothetical protein
MPWRAAEPGLSVPASITRAGVDGKCGRPDPVGTVRILYGLCNDTGGDPGLSVAPYYDGPDLLARHRMTRSNACAMTR